MHWTRLWNEYRIVSIRRQRSVKNTSVMAEMFMALDIGFGNGGEGSIAKYYRHNKGQSEAHFESLRKNVDRIVQEIIEKTGESLLIRYFLMRQISWPCLRQWLICAARWPTVELAKV